MVQRIRSEIYQPASVYSVLYQRGGPYDPIRLHWRYITSFIVQVAVTGPTVDLDCILRYRSERGSSIQLQSTCKVHQCFGPFRRVVVLSEDADGLDGEEFLCSSRLPVTDITF